MAITQAMCTSFKEDLFNKEQDLDTDTIKIALYTSSASLDATTTAYTTSQRSDWYWLYCWWRNSCELNCRLQVAQQHMLTLITQSGQAHLLQLAVR